MTATVLVAGGGTGGHVFPSLAVAHALAARDVRPYFVGTARGLEARLVPEAGFGLQTVATPPLRRRLHPGLARLPVAVATAAAAVVTLARRTDARAAVSFGGYVSVPLVLAARWLRLPLVVHEQNAVPGVANRLAARWATTVALSFPSARDRLPRRVPTVFTGNPVRPGLGQVDRGRLRAEAMSAFDLDPARRTLLVFGGSQGAQRLNDALVAATTGWSQPGGLQVLHATGRGQHAAVERSWARARPADHGLHVRAVDFIERMDLAYAAADVVLCRAGASSIAELTVLGLPSVLVPYPHATADHQTANARDLEQAGGARVLADADVDATTLRDAVAPLLTDPDRARRMGAAAAGFGRPHAADAVADLVRDAAGLDEQRQVTP